MRHLSINYGSDAAATLAAALSPMGSLACSRAAAADLLRAIGVEVLPYLANRPRLSMEEAARRIIEEAVPEEGDPHPRRATVHFDLDRQAVKFLTPGDVCVAVSPWGLIFDFGRNSQYLSSSIIASVAMATGRPFRAEFCD